MAIKSTTTTAGEKKAKKKIEKESTEQVKT